MTLDEIKSVVAVIPAEDRLRLAAFLKHLERKDSPANRAVLSATDRRIDAGDCVTLEQLQRIHTALQQEGT